MAKPALRSWDILGKFYPQSQEIEEHLNNYKEWNKQIGKLQDVKDPITLIHGDPGIGKTSYFALTANLLRNTESEWKNPIEGLEKPPLPKVIFIDGTKGDKHLLLFTVLQHLKNCVVIIDNFNVLDVEYRQVLKDLKNQNGMKFILVMSQHPNFQEGVCKDLNTAKNKIIKFHEQPRETAKKFISAILNPKYPEMMGKFQQLNQLNKQNQLTANDKEKLEKLEQNLNVIERQFDQVYTMTGGCMRDLINVCTKSSFFKMRKI